MSGQKIMPCLWFDGNAEEAVGLYLLAFRSGRVTSTTRRGDEGPGAPGTGMQSGDPDARGRLIRAILPVHKLDIATLQQALEANEGGKSL